MLSLKRRRYVVPEIGGVRTESLMTIAMARMVRKKREIFTALLVSSRFFSQLALLSVADGFSGLLSRETSSSSACWLGIRLTFVYREINE
jgi:hypothetical protein